MSGVAPASAADMLAGRSLRAVTEEASMAAHSPGPGLHGRGQFIRCLMGVALLGLAFLTVSLEVGMRGYHGLAGLIRIDSWLNVAVILRGTEPASAMPADTAETFASAHANFSGAAYPAATAIIDHPFVPRRMVVQQTWVTGGWDGT